MTCNNGIVLIVLIAVIVAIGTIPYHMLFKQYCARIAELEGRTEECHSLKATEGGMNWIEIEHAGKIWSRYYLKFSDERLTDMGDRLIKWGIPGLLVVIILLGVMIFVKTSMCM